MAFARYRRPRPRVDGHRDRGLGTAFVGGLGRYRDGGIAAVVRRATGAGNIGPLDSSGHIRRNQAGVTTRVVGGGRN